MEYNKCLDHDNETLKEETRERLEAIKSRVFDSGAKRDNDDLKPLVNSFKGYTRLRFGYHMKKGASKYGDSNWEKGIPTESYLQSLDRHIAMYLNGDRSEDHLAAGIFNLQGIMLNEQKEGISPDSFFNRDKI